MPSFWSRVVEVHDLVAAAVKRKRVSYGPRVSKNGGTIKPVHSMTLSQAIRLRYPHEDYRGVDLRAVVERLCRDYIDSGLGDRNSEQRLCAEDDATYWQQFSEVLLARELTKVGIAATRGRVGPDFLITHEGKKIWIEAITPKPEGIPERWLQRNVEEAMGLPHQEILLRWTAAIKEKAEKLIGRTQDNVKGYLQKGIVAQDDAYIVAINGY